VRAGAEGRGLAVALRFPAPLARGPFPG
jgi:hypothetical protein